MTSWQSLEEIDRLTGGVQEKIEDGRKKVKDITENITALKEKHTELTEKRKEMWREDAKLDSLVNRAADELKTAERILAGMMDKAFCFLFFLFSVLTLYHRILARGSKP